MASADRANRDWRPEDIRCRVLLSVPDARNIPYFALGVEAKRRLRVETEVVDSKDRLSPVVSGNVFRKLQSSRYGDHRLIRVRRRVLQKTAVYSSWLAFPTLDMAEAFARENPRFGLHAIEARTDVEFKTIDSRLKEAVAKGRYNLGSLQDGARLIRAREYVELAERLDKSRWAGWTLSKLREDLAAVPDGVSVG